MEEETKIKPDILEVKKSDQYETVENLFKKSKPTPVYYMLLLLSSLIIASGLLLNNSVIVIGGMLVTPLLTPILLIALGISVGEIDAIRAAVILVLKSLFIIVIVSFVLAIFLGFPSKGLTPLVDSFRTAVLYFIVAFISGIAATFAWIRKEISEILPGIAIAVSLVPPLCLLGIALSILDLSYVRLVFFTFIFNLIGVILGSMVVFSLLKFHKTEKVIRKEANLQETENNHKE